MATRKHMSPEVRPKNDLAAHLLDLLEPLGGVTARSMFGEYGFFKNGSMFACKATTSTKRATSGPGARTGTSRRPHRGKASAKR